MDALIVAVGGGMGAALRHGVNVAAARLGLTGFPYATLVINIAGGLAMGLFVGWLAGRSGTPPWLRLFVATGILGGFTTFSAFSLDFAVLWEQGAQASAIVYACASVVGAVLAVFAGLWIGRQIF